VYGLFDTSQMFVNKNKLVLGLRNLFEINKNGPHVDYLNKRALCMNEFYLPPEQSFSKPGDVWSLGILLHEVLTGLLPFNEKTGYF
jgi:serine/threonine protein kinase